MQKIFHHKFFLLIILLTPIIFVSPVHASIEEATPLDLESTIPPNTPLLQTYGTITGTVTGGGQPLTTVDVTVYYYDNNLDGWDYVTSSNTDSSGQYSIVDLEPGLYRLGFFDRANQHLSEFYNDVESLETGTDIIITAGETVNIDAVLTLGGRITGTVTDSNGPTSEFSVGAYQYNDGTGDWEEITRAYPDIDGNYTIQGLETGTYRVEFSPWDFRYISSYYQDALDLSNATDIEVIAGSTVSGIDAVLIEGGRITGTVTDSIGPVTSVRIKALKYNNSTGWELIAQTNPYNNGNYGLQGLQPGAYRVKFEPYDNDPHLPSYYQDATDLSNATDINVTTGDTVSGINAVLTEGGRITGTVTDSNGPFSTVDIRAYQYNGDTDNWKEINWTTSPDENGNYTLQGLQTGTYRVEFDPWNNYNYLSAYYQDATSLSSATNIDVIAGSTVSGIDGFLQEPACIRGNVIKAIDSARVRVDAYLADEKTSPIAQSYLDQYGDYNIFGLYPGTYRVHFTELTGQGISLYYDQATTFDSATAVEVPDRGCADHIDAYIPEAGSITDIQRPRFIQPDETITAKLNFTIPEGLNTPPYLGVKIPPGWSFSGDATYTGDNSGTFTYDSDLALELQIEHGGNWWAGSGTVDLWNEAETSLQLTLQSSTASGDYLPTFVIGTSQGWGRLEEAPVRITEQIPVRGVDVTAVRDYESYDIGDSTSLQQAQDMNMEVIYHYLGWNATEVQHEYYHWVILDDILKQARAYNQKVILRIYNPPAHYEERVLFNQGLSGADLQAQDIVEHKIKRFMQRLTQHVKEVGLNDVVAGYVIWNEPNIAGEWGAPPDPAAYMTMLRSAYEGAKEGDLATIIISAPLAPTEDTPGEAINDLTYLGQLYDLGLVDYVDYIGMNGLGFQYDPDHNSVSVDYDFMRLKHLHDVMLSKGDQTHKAWVLEVGWLRESDYNMGDFEPYKVTKEQQAEYLCRAFQKAHSEWYDWVDVMTVWNLDFKDYPHNYPPESAFHWYSISDNELAKDCLTNLTFAETGTIAGTVTDGTNPIPNIDVLVHKYDELLDDWDVVAEGQTDNQGNYSVGDLETGTYRVEFSDWNAIYLSEYYDDQSYFYDATDITVYSGQTTSGINAELTRATGGRITGSVTDGTNPIPYIDVVAYRYDSSLDDWIFEGWNHTNAAGEYVVGYLEPGIYRVEFYDSFGYYIGEFYNDQPDLDNATSIDVLGGQATSHINAELAFVDGARISGTVTDGTDPIPYIQVVVYQYDNNGDTWTEIGNSYTNVEGNFTIAGLEAGTFSLQFVDRYNSLYIPEFYDDEPDLDNATGINISQSQIITGIDAILSSAQGNSPDNSAYLPIILSP